MSKLSEFYNNNFLLIIRSLIILILIGLFFFPDLHFGSVIAIFLIITIHLKQKRYEEKTREHLRCHQVANAVFKDCPDAIFIKDVDLKYVSGNRSLVDLMHLDSFDEIKDKNDYELFGEDDSKEKRETDQKVIETGQSLTYDNVFKWRGHEHILEITKTPLCDQANIVNGVVGIIRDVTAERNWAKKIEQEQSLLQLVIDNVPFLAHVRDLHGKILAKSKYGDLLFDKNRHDNYEEAFANFFNENIYEIREVDKQMFETQKPVIIKKEFYIDDKPFFLEVHKIPLFNERKEIDRILVVAKDITFEKEIEEQKETFVATLSHDLKTPTIAQIKAIEYLLNTESTALNKNDKEILSEVYNSCKYMNRMINNLVMTYKYSNGRIVLNHEKFDLLNLFDESCKEVRFLFENSTHKIKVETNCSECILCADALEIKRVLMNLLSNAISYSCPKSEVVVKIESHEKGITFSIANSSRYSIEGDLNLFFDKYAYACHNKKTSSGLGLYLSKQIIEAHKGEIFAKRQDNLCVFGFTLYKDTMAQYEFECSDTNSSL